MTLFPNVTRICSSATPEHHLTVWGPRGGRRLIGMVTLGGVGLPRSAGILGSRGGGTACGTSGTGGSDVAESVATLPTRSVAAESVAELPTCVVTEDSAPVDCFFELANIALGEASAPETGISPV